MTELELYKFTMLNCVAYEYFIDNDKNEVFRYFVPVFVIQDFYTLLEGYSIFEGDGIVCNMKEGFFEFDMKSICEKCNIDYKNVFEYKYL